MEAVVTPSGTVAVQRTPASNVLLAAVSVNCVVDGDVAVNVVVPQPDRVTPDKDPTVNVGRLKVMASVA